jgi:hypothetical protein
VASYQFLVTVELERESGKFAGRDEIESQLVERLDEAACADVDGVGADGDSTYVVTDYSVEVLTSPKKSKAG